ncbi:MAG: hypothetical protein Q9213_002116 [Squamulea squamosa]
MDRIAPELQHMIFAGVYWTDIPNLRLTCKTLAEVGLQYLFSEWKLSFNTKSFDHLQQLLQHPARYCVKSLTYNIWVQKKPSSNWFWKIHDLYLKTASKFIRNLMKMLQNMNGAPGEKVVKKLDVFDDQQSLRDLEDGEKRITSALAQLVNLKHLCFDNTSVELPPPYGIPQILSTIQAIDSAGIYLESLTRSCVNWRIFEIQEDHYQMLKRVVSNLSLVNLYFDTHELLHQPVEASMQACAKLFRQGRPLDFFQSIPLLRVLKVSSESCIITAERVDLKYVVGNIIWSNLREVCLRGFVTTHDDLVQFLQNHVRTLRTVVLSEINLVQGLWSNVFKYMATSLHLGECKLDRLFNHPSLLDDWLYHESMILQDFVLNRANVSFDDAARACRLDYPHNHTSYRPDPTAANYFLEDSTTIGRRHID